MKTSQKFHILTCNFKGNYLSTAETSILAWSSTTGLILIGICGLNKRKWFLLALQQCSNVLLPWLKITRNVRQFETRFLLPRVHHSKMSKGKVGLMKRIQHSTSIITSQSRTLIDKVSHQVSVSTRENTLKIS